MQRLLNLVRKNIRNLPRNCCPLKLLKSGFCFLRLGLKCFLSQKGILEFSSSALDKNFSSADMD